MDLIHTAVEVAAVVISIAGVMVVLWGIAEAVYRFVRLKLSFHSTANLGRDISIRRDLGAHLLLGLEIFIASDIISSVASPSWEKVGLLGAIVGIRTVLSFFLSMEMKGELTLRDGTYRGQPGEQDGGDRG